VDSKCVLQRVIRVAFLKGEERVEVMAIAVVNCNVSCKFVP